MIYIILGCLAFGFLFIFDINKIKRLSNRLNISFALGVALLIYSTIGIIISDTKIFTTPMIIKILCIMISLVSLLIMIYAIFFSLPFVKTYREIRQTNILIDTGMFALCRHPGVIWFFIAYISLWLATGKMMLLWAGIIWTIMDVLHVYIQDRWHFPKTFDGYIIYKQNVPFVIPNRTSIKRCISTLRENRVETRNK